MSALISSGPSASTISNVVACVIAKALRQWLHYITAFEVHRITRGCMGLATPGWLRQGQLSGARMSCWRRCSTGIQNGTQEGLECIPYGSVQQEQRQE